MLIGVLIFLFIITAIPYVAISSIVQFGFAAAWEDFRGCIIGSIICIPLLIITIAAYFVIKKENKEKEAYFKSEIEKTNHTIEMQKVFVCPKCGFITYALPDDQKECSYCNTFMVNTEIPREQHEEEIAKYDGTNDFNVNERLNREYTYSSPLYDMEKEAERLKDVVAKLKEERKQEAERQAKEQALREEKEFERTLYGTKPSVKCPLCGSHYVVKIGALDRAASVHFWGLASSKIGKQYECKDCRHKF